MERGGGGVNWRHILMRARAQETEQNKTKTKKLDGGAREHAPRVACSCPTLASRSGSWAKGTRSTRRAFGSGGGAAAAGAFFTSKKLGAAAALADRTRAAAKCVATDGANGNELGHEPSGKRSPAVFESCKKKTQTTSTKTPKPRRAAIKKKTRRCIQAGCASVCVQRSALATGVINKCALQCFLTRPTWGGGIDLCADLVGDAVSVGAVAANFHRRAQARKHVRRGALAHAATHTHTKFYTSRTHTDTPVDERDAR